MKPEPGSRAYLEDHITKLKQFTRTVPYQVDHLSFNCPECQCGTGEPCTDDGIHSLPQHETHVDRHARMLRHQHER